MISNYLKELIENNNRIIIPDFGAFMIQDTPEGKQISFNDFLKFNDGLLVNQIIKAEKISKNEASEKITVFIKAVEKSFAEHKAYEIKGIGFLSKDSHGNIKFETKPETTTSPTDVKPTIVLDEEPVKAKEEVKVEAIKNEPKKVATPPKTEPVKTTKETTTKPEIKTPVTGKPKTINKPTYSAPMEISSSNNTRNLIIIVAAVVIILGGGTWAFFAFDLKDKFFGKEMTAPVAVDIPAPVDSTAIMDTVAEMDTITEPMVIEEPEETVETYTKKYYIIAGSFKVPSNAVRYNQKLINEGYNSEILERKNGFKVVSYKVVYSWGEALTEWKNMRHNNPQTWIYIR
jgi:nucleoid DNA-binding protein